MSLSDYIVDSDQFEPEEYYGLLAFPCNVCKHRQGKDTDAPCRDCGHNVCRVTPQSEEARRVVGRKEKLK